MSRAPEGRKPDGFWEVGSGKPTLRGVLGGEVCKSSISHFQETEGSTGNCLLAARVASHAIRSIRHTAYDIRHTMPVIWRMVQRCLLPAVLPLLRQDYFDWEAGSKAAQRARGISPKTGDAILEWIEKNSD
jgi:hypothetical protein